MPFSHGKFSGPGSAKHISGEKSAPSPKKEEMQAPHGGQQQHSGGEKHVTETNPGETQPHPQTGVHAFHGHHVGGGKFKSHTHHDGGDVETRDHASADEMHQAGKEALPGMDSAQAPPPDDKGGTYTDALSGIGGDSQYG